MIRVLIVDDDILVRNNIRNIINWGGNGFVICGEATNGKVALEAIEKLNPHIVVMDVSMPLMDGVELSQYINDRFKNIKMIILSSYDKFEYVRDTMKNGAVDYILKHKLNAKELLGLLEKVRDEILTESRQRDEMEQFTRKWEIISPAVQQSFIKDLVLGINDVTDKTDKYFETIGLQNFTKNIVVVVMQIVNFLIITEKYSDKDKSLFIKSVIDLCQQSMNKFNNCIISYIEHGKYVILFSFEQQRSESMVNRLLHDYLNKISETIGLYLGINVAFGVSELCKNIKDIPKYYKQASSRPEGIFVAGSGSQNGKIGNSDNNHFVSLSITQEKNLLSAMESLDFEKAESVISMVFNGLKANSVDFQSIQMCINELISIADKVARKEGIVLNETSQDEIMWKERFSRYRKLEEVYAFILNYYRSLIEKLRKNGYAYSHNILKAINYIREHYCENISLNEVAETIGLSPQYLCSLFKKETGIGFSDYLNKVRIEKAKDLIEEGRSKVKTIYNIVGFNNYSYFFKVFKDITGITPIEYSRKKHRKKI